MAHNTLYIILEANVVAFLIDGGDIVDSYYVGRKFVDGKEVPGVTLVIITQPNQADNGLQFDLPISPVSLRAAIVESKKAGEPWLDVSRGNLVDLKKKYEMGHVNRPGSQFAYPHR